MRRFFVKNLIFVIILNLLVKPVWIFFVDRGVQNRVGHEAYGTYQALFSLAFMFQIVLDFGLTSYNSRVISQQPDRLKTVFPAMLSARIVLLLLYAVLVCGLGLAFGYRGWEIWMLIGVLLIMAMNSLLQFIRSNVAAMLKFRVDGVLSIIDRFLMIVVCGFMLLYPPIARHFKIEWFVIAQIICYAIAGLIAFFVLKHIAKVQLRFSFNFQDSYKVIKESLPYALNIFLMSVYNKADATMIERLGGKIGKDQTGIYAGAYRLFDGSNMLGLMFAAMLLPLFGRMLAEKQNIQPIIKLCVNLMLPVSFIIAIAAAFYGTPIMHLLYHSAGTYDGQILAWLLAAFPPFCLMYVYSTLLTANGDLKLLIKISIAGVILNLGANFYVIPHYYALGAAVTTFITQTMVTVCFVIFSKKIFKLPFNIKWISAHVTYLLLLIVLAWGIRQCPFSWVAQLAILGTAGLLLMFVFRFVSVAALKQLANRK